MRTSPAPPQAVSKLAWTRYRRSRNERELAFAPKPLSGIAMKLPMPGASSSALNPPTGWRAPGASTGSAFGAPANGAGQLASAGRSARAASVGSSGGAPAAAGAGASVSAQQTAANAIDSGSLGMAGMPPSPGAAVVTGM